MLTLVFGIAFLIVRAVQKEERRRAERERALFEKKEKPKDPVGKP